VHVEHLERRRPALRHPAETSLRRLLRRWRWQLGLERLALFGIRGALVGGLALVALSFAVWFSDGDRKLLCLAAAPLLAALVLGVLRWPSHQLTAVTVDRRLALEERLATALELNERGSYGGRFAALQLQDTLERTQSQPTRLLALGPRARNEALLALLAAVLAAAVLILMPRLPRPVTATPSIPETISDAPAAPDEPVQRALPLDASQESATTPNRAQPAAPAADLAARVQQEQAERAALDKLAQALSNVSAGQPAANAIQQGDLSGARDQLQSLADNADQLTAAAKKQLARGLQDAAAASTQSDRALADREQQAAQALARSNYADQRQTLRALADQLQRSGQRSVPSDQLERDQGQLQQQSAASSQRGAPGSSSQSTGGQPSADQAGQGTQGSDGQGAAAGSSNQGGQGSGAGQQTGAGVGTGSDPNLYSDQPSRLETSGQEVQVPTRLGVGPGVRPANGTEDQQQPDSTLNGRSTAELAQSQQTGQVVPEQNLVPGEQRPVVRGYFR
jgi:hypothetical protein